MLGVELLLQLRLLVLKQLLMLRFRFLLGGLQGGLSVALCLLARLGNDFSVGLGRFGLDALDRSARFLGHLLLVGLDRGVRGLLRGGDSLLRARGGRGSGLRLLLQLALQGGDLGVLRRRLLGVLLR